MALQSASKMAEFSSASQSSGKVNLQSILSDGRKSLATINDERILLQHNIQRNVQAINQVNADYWITQAKGFQHSVGNDDIDEAGKEWRADFATREIMKAEAAAAKQKQLWSQIDRMIQDAKGHDDKFWATWQESLRQIAATGEPTQRLSFSREAKPSVQQPRRGVRFTRATAKGSSPQGPTAFTAKRANSRLTKLSRHGTPSALQKSSLHAAKSLKTAANDVDSHLPESSDLSSSPAPASASANTKKAIRTTSRGQKTKARLPRAVTAKQPIKPAPVTKPAARRTRAAKPAKARVNPHPVTDPQPGQLYQAYYHSNDMKERGWYMGTVLPWTSSDWPKEMMMDISMRDMDLEADWPDCCEPGYKTEMNPVDGKPVETGQITCIKRWMPGFEDGGPRIMERKFLFLFFEDRPKRLGCLNIDPTEPMALIRFEKTGEPVPIDWVAATDLRGFDVDDGTLIRGELTAEKYRNKLDVVAHLRAQASAGLTSMTNLQRSESLVGMTRYPPTVDGYTLYRPLETSSSVKAKSKFVKQECGTIPLPFNARPTGTPNEHRPSQKEHGQDYLNALSPGQTDIDEAYEEPQTFAKRTAGKRPLDNGFDEYDEGLGMDYDLNLKKSATQMSRPQASLTGFPPHKLPRLDDYNMHRPGASGPGLQSPGSSSGNAGFSRSRSGSNATQQAEIRHIMPLIKAVEKITADPVQADAIDHPQGWRFS